LHLLVMVRETVGPDWLSPNLFRIGASSLVDDLVRQILWTSRGQYAAMHDVGVT
jgi:deoxyribose-phosphate aldolase